MKGVLKALLALVIIVGGAGIGYLIANSTDIGKTGNPSPTPVVAVVNAAPATPIPTFTPGAAGSGTQAGAGTTRQGGNNANAATTPGAGGTTAAGQGQQTGQGQGNQRRGNQLVGTVSSFDANTKLLVVSAQDGSKRNVAVGNALVTKAEKITLDDISKTSGAIVVVQGEKGSDGTYSARSLNLVEPSAAQGGAGGGRGAFGGGAGGFGGAGGQGQNSLVILTGATVSGNTLTGKSFQGEDIKVNVSDSTTMSKQAPASVTDLTEGKAVTVTGQPGSNGDMEASLVAITG